MERVNPGDLVHKAIDAHFEQGQEASYRRHLGASVVGDKCARSVWFHFRWTVNNQFSGRMLRLFQRGHQEEARFVSYLEAIGAQVWTVNASTGKQFQVTDCGGHFGGSCDGVASGLPGIGHPVLLEMKTHNDKSFAELKKKGLKSSKPRHWKQAQVYMRGLDLRGCLYMAVNKNDDDLFLHYFERDDTEGRALAQRASSLIFTDQAPPRISDSPSWFECRFCDYNKVCFGSAMPEVNCRTCAHSTPEQNGTWSCRFGRSEISAMPEKGCEMHVYNPTFFPHATVTGMSLEENSVTYQTRNKGTVVNGSCVTATPSKELDLTC